MFLLHTGRTALLELRARHCVCFAVQALQACSTSSARGDAASFCGAPCGESASSNLSNSPHRGTATHGSAPDASWLSPPGSREGQQPLRQSYHTQPRPIETVDCEDDPAMENADYGLGADWEQVRPQIFSIRPSVLSPLHPIYREQQAIAQRAAYTDVALTAQLKLSEALDPPPRSSTAEADAAIGAQIEDRFSAVRSLLEEAREVRRPDLLGTLAECPSPEVMHGYYHLLEEQLRDQDADFVGFNRVLAGEVSAWDYWFQQFLPVYEGLPSLERLEVIYNKADLQQEVQQLRRAALRSLAPEPVKQRQPRRDRLGRALAIGRRKTSAAQVYLWPGEGRILVNRRPIDAYFPDVMLRVHALRPLMATGSIGRFNILVQVDGGGVSGQAQAAGHGIARALQDYDPAAYRKRLKQLGMLKRDPRMVERKKPGKPKARKSFTWVKR